MTSSSEIHGIYQKFVLVAIAIICSVAILLNSYMLRLGTPLDSLFMFWLPLLVLGFLMFYTAFTFDSKYPLIHILIFAFTLHIIQFVRQPPDMIWNTDSIFVYKVVENILKTGSYKFGFGTGMAPIYTYYPIFYVFLSGLSSITALSPIVVTKYSMAILNLSTLLGFYALLSLLKLDFKSKNLVLCVFNLNPMFHFFNSYAHAESFAIIFYPLILLYAIKSGKAKHSNKSTILATSLIIVVSMSHHFSSYMTALALVGTTFLLYILSRRTFVQTELNLMALIAPLTWLMFISYFLFTQHITKLGEILASLTSFHLSVGYSATTIQTSITHYPSVFSEQITILRDLLLVVLTFIGFLIYRKHKERVFSFFGALLFLTSAITFVSLYVVNWVDVGIGPRTRLLEFAFFPIAIFFALGIISISKKLSNFFKASQLKKRINPRKFITLMFVLVLVTIFLPSTIFNAFGRQNYDSTYSAHLADEVQVAPEAHYYLGKWVLANLDPVENSVFAGSISAYKYVIGYGQQQKWASEIFTTDSIKEGMQGTWYRHFLYYVVNRKNLQLPEFSGREMNETITTFLTENFSRIYDNGAVELYRQSTSPIVNIP